MKDKEESLSFIFTEWGFSADEEGGELTDSMKQWKQRFGKDCWQALYDLGFQGKGGGRPFLCLPVAPWLFLCPCASDVAALSFSEGKDGDFSAGRGAKKAHECDSRRTGRGMGR